MRASEPADRRPAPAGALRQPALGGAASWLNVDHPPDLAEPKGRAVVVDFWTSGCINCIHTLATLKKIEARFSGQPVVVIGIHSPKFDAEGESARLASTLDAYDLPTVMVLDTEGGVVSKATGEPDLAALSTQIEGALAEGGAKLAHGPLPGTASAAEAPARSARHGKSSRGKGSSTSRSPARTRSA